jgi:hypothetical protein
MNRHQTFEKARRVRVGRLYFLGVDNSERPFALPTSPLVGTDPTITSGSAVIRADQQLLGHFGKRRAACVSLQSAHCCI